MGRDAGFGIVLALLGLAGGIVAAVIFAQHPEWADFLLYGSLAFCAVCVVAGGALLFWPKKPTRVPAMTVPRKPKGIVIENCEDVTLTDNRGHNLDTFIEATNTRGLKAHRNTATQTNTFMRADRVSGLDATENCMGDTAAPSTSSEKSRRGRYFPGWRSKTE